LFSLKDNESVNTTKLLAIELIQAKLSRYYRWMCFCAQKTKNLGSQNETGTCYSKKEKN
jgi:hypothetical protein